MDPLPPDGSVLVVDDDPVLGSLISRGLRGVGYAVTSAEDGNKAIAALETSAFDAVVIDIIMPDREGVETIIEIRARWPKVKIIAMSGGGRIDPDMFLNLAETLGADSVLKKPFKLPELLSLLGAPPLPPNPHTPLA